MNDGRASHLRLEFVRDRVCRERFSAAVGFAAVPGEVGEEDRVAGLEGDEHFFAVVGLVERDAEAFERLTGDRAAERGLVEVLFVGFELPVFL